jgi:large subunit ribosomal protein L18
MNHQKSKHIRQLRRRRHVRRKIIGTSDRPRLTVHRSSKHIYAQLIDDLKGVTLAAAGSSGKGGGYGGNIKAAKAVGAKLAETAKAKGIARAAFDRGHYRYHGRIKALAEAANAGGLLCCEPKPGKKKVEAAKPAKGPKEDAAKAAKAAPAEKPAAKPKKEPKEQAKKEETKKE